MSEYREGLGYNSDELQEIYRATSNEAYVTVTSDRYMTVEPDSFIAGVVGDHNSNPVRIRCDRYVDGGDLTNCNHFYVAWQNPSAQISGRTEIDSIAVDPDNTNKIICIWLVDHLACGHPGLLEITFQAIKEDDDGEILYQWQTRLNNAMRVLNGIDPSYTATNDVDSHTEVEWYIEESELTAMLTEVLV